MISQWFRGFQRFRRSRRFDARALVFSAIWRALDIVWIPTKWNGVLVKTGRSQVYYGLGLSSTSWGLIDKASWLVITTAWNCYQSRSAGSGSTCPGCRSGSAKMMQIWPDPVPLLVISKVKFLNTPYAIQNVESKQCREASTYLTWNRYTVR